MKKKSRPTINTAVMVLLDVIVFNFCYFGSIIARYDFQYQSIPGAMSQVIMARAPIFTLITLLVYAIFQLYKNVWAYASTREMLNVILAVLVSVGVQYVYFRFIFKGFRMPSGFFIIEFCTLTILTLFIRFLSRFSVYLENEKQKNKQAQIPTLLIGAGGAGRMILRDLESSAKSKNEVLGIVDDDPELWNKKIRGVTVYGGRYQIPALVQKLGIQEIIFAIPSIDRKSRREIIDICKTTSCKLMTLPGIYQLVNGEVKVSQLRQVNVEDLLGRDPIQVASDEIFDYIRGRKVLVTGAGGTIGSELSRQIASHQPGNLVLLDVDENNLHDLYLELKGNYPSVNLQACIASIRDFNRLDSLFKQVQPDLVYHAAAHKHVPLMEISPNEAIKNNVFGTLNLAKVADKYGVKRFVQISTDKAVNPTNVMGASKRICEMIMQAMSRRSQTQFVCVRFGNVLGSSGSVVPLFRKQIANGGPVTVTHPEIVRYFMTIPEAVSLVLQASVYAQGGEIFVLDMGEPVKIVDLARNMIRLSGYVPDVDIKIVYTGLRPGEKLYEEVLMDEEGLKKTQNDRIFIGQPIQFEDERFFSQLEWLKEAADQEPEDIRPWVAALVPTFKKSIDGIPVDFNDKQEEAKDESN